MRSTRFFSDARGGVSVMFAFAVIPLIVAMGAAVDYSIASQTEGELQDALDAAVLAGAATNATYGEDRLIEARHTFAANFLRDIPVEPVFTMGDGTITGTVVMEVPTAFMASSASTGSMSA